MLFSEHEAHQRKRVSCLSGLLFLCRNPSQAPAAGTLQRNHPKSSSSKPDNSGSSHWSPVQVSSASHRSCSADSSLTRALSVRVQKCADLNQMCTKNLSLLFAPSLFQTDGKGEHEVKIVEDLIDNYLFVFDVSKPRGNQGLLLLGLAERLNDPSHTPWCFRSMRSIRPRLSWRSVSSPPGRTLRSVTFVS